MKTLRTRSARMAAAAVIGIFALVPSGVAVAKIRPVDTSCTNNGGNDPGGQQPTCTGGGLNQNTENQNPAGQAPPGQNP
jgi:hypothetical protein